MHTVCIIYEDELERDPGPSSTAKSFNQSRNKSFEMGQFEHHHSMLSNFDSIRESMIIDNLLGPLRCNFNRLCVAS